MRNLVIALSIAVALLAGCIIGATASRLVVPPVRAGTNPVKWEYSCFDQAKTSKVQTMANQLGRVGFEMVASHGNGRTEVYNTWCFKRRLP